MTNAARRDPLSQKQPVHAADLVERQLRDGLGELPKGATVQRETNKLTNGTKYQQFVVRCWGREWSLGADMSTSAAYQSGQSIARMMAEAKPTGGTDGKNS